MHMKHRLHTLRLLLLQHFTHALPRVRDVGGVRALPLMQVILSLTTDLDPDSDKDATAFDALLRALIEQLDMRVSGDICRLIPRSVYFLPSLLF